MKPKETYPASPKALQEKQRSGTLNIETLKTIVPKSPVQLYQRPHLQGFKVTHILCAYTQYVSLCEQQVMWIVWEKR